MSIGPASVRPQLEIIRVLAWQTCWRLHDKACSNTPITILTAHQFLHEARPLLRALLLRHLHDRLDAAHAADPSTVARPWTALATLNTKRIWTSRF